MGVKKALFLSCLPLLLATGLFAAWEPGEPVVTYGDGPGGPEVGPGGPRLSRLTDAWLLQLKEGGFNTVWATAPDELDLAARHGVRAIYFLDPNTMKSRYDISDPGQAAALETRINRVKSHPALYVYALYDEPSAREFAALARLKEFVRRLDPEHAVWVNLNPIYANVRHLGTEGDRVHAYWDHLRLFGEVFRPDFLSYDNYQFRVQGDRNDYLQNLGMIRQSATAQGIPFWNGVQACSWVPGEAASPKSPRIPGPDEMRFLVHSTAAYGAQGIYYYVYFANGHRGTIVAPDGTPDAKFAVLKTLNRAFVSIARELRPLRFAGAYLHGIHAPGTAPYCEQALLCLAPEAPSGELQPLQELTGTTLVTRFDAPGRPTHLMVVNCDYRTDRTLHVTAPSSVERFDALERRWSPVGDAFDLALMRGSGVLLRLKPDVAEDVSSRSK